MYVLVVVGNDVHTNFLFQIVAKEALYMHHFCVYTYRCRIPLSST